MIYAVYGSLRKELSNHRILQESELLGEYVTPPIYSMYSLGSFPGVVPKGDTSITLELYEVVEESIEKDLDRLEGYHPYDKNNSFYLKEKLETPFGEAFIYFVNKDYLSSNIEAYEKVPSGNWKEYLNMKK